MKIKCIQKNETITVTESPREYYLNKSKPEKFACMKTGERSDIFSDNTSAQQHELEEAISQARETERIRLGHELHDNVSQILGVSKVYLDLLNPVNKDEIEIKEKIAVTIQAAIDEIRNLSHKMVNPETAPNGLIDSIKGLVDEIQYARLFNIEFTYSNEVELLQQTKKVSLFRIVQEQLNNIIKYSHAKNVQIRLNNKQHKVQLSVEDDGIGFDLLAVQKGIGLSGIYERAKLCNGSVELLTAPGCGCKLKVMASAA